MVHSISQFESCMLPHHPIVPYAFNPNITVIGNLLQKIGIIVMPLAIQESLSVNTSSAVGPAVFSISCLFSSIIIQHIKRDKPFITAPNSINRSIFEFLKIGDINSLVKLNKNFNMNNKWLFSVLTHTTNDYKTLSNIHYFFTNSGINAPFFPHTQQTSLVVERFGSK